MLLLTLLKKLFLTRKKLVILAIALTVTIVNITLKSPVEEYKSTISNTATVICDGMVLGCEAYNISTENTKILIEYFTSENWKKISLDSDISPYEYLIFDDLIIGIVDSEDDNLIIQIYNKDKKYGEFYIIEHYVFDIKTLLI